MAAGPVIIPNLAFLNFFNVTNLLNTANSFKATLHTSAMAPNPATMEVYADVSASELATGFGYTSGGLALANDALTQTAGVLKWTGDPLIWNAAGGSIPAWRYGVLRASGTLNGKVDPIVGYFLGDATPADVPATTSGNPLTITPNASGFIGGTK